jgi:hypothetical protein
MQDILEKFGLKYEELNTSEIDTLNGWMAKVDSKIVTLEDIKTMILSMRDAVERELINEPEFIYIFFFKCLNRKQILLKARLQNYLLILDFLTTPEKAKKALERAIEGMVKHKTI